MKKKIVALTAIVTLSVGLVGQASASSIHTVKSGDTLWSISQANNVSVKNLQEWNELNNSTLIYPRQKLKVEDAVSTYTVVKGDSLYKIALANSMSVSELMKLNNLSSDLIHPGDQFVLNGQASAGNTATTSTNSSTAATRTTAVSAPSKAKEMTVTATAYTAFCTGCSGITYTGIDLRSNPNQKVIAVDPSVIPLGSRVWVEGYGEAIAGDTGGAIKGNKIDVFIPSRQEALNWGRKTVNIKILD
ncbi:LysM peptidoglycan-binding and 3D domain-containing protein [Paenisporosarcina sp. TG20]|uniref:LysM peptidoglycan-binding and 3D domain-containing protein n=1 Tax=Paenisporosarcina sp. TG20 TaxID=1211706 RepID=UPI0003828F04|nr:3D domain-containing protein [Paenisporosarcina sp. TG20]